VTDRKEATVADLSVIVTAYNIEDYIEQCLESVAAQTLSDFEVLVVDDGSTDSTPDRINEFCSGDPRFIPVLPRPTLVSTGRRGGGSASWTATTTSNRPCSSGCSVLPPAATLTW
jgi:GT2 family glycosyltransferase